MEFLFILFLFGSIYSYFIYPLLLKLLPAQGASFKSAIEDQELPCMDLIVTAHNEEGRIQKKIDDCLAIDYPKEKLQIIIASDCSSDNTDDIVCEYEADGVHLVRADEHKGKEYAQLCAIRSTQSTLIVFSDVATSIEPNALRTLAGYFADTKVGAVSSEDRFISQDGSVVGEGAYVKYEMWLRRQESVRAGLVGLSGSFFAARRKVCEDWDISAPSDFNTALNCAKAGYIAVSAPDVVGIYSDVKDPSLEYQRKLRTIIRGITAIYRHPEVLNPLAMGLFSFQVWGHKIFRWSTPWFLLLLFVITFFLAEQSWVYMLFLAGQTIFYGAALLGHISQKMRDYLPIKIACFFVQVNVAIAHATILFATGKRMTTWVPSQR